MHYLDKNSDPREQDRFYPISTLLIALFISIMLYLYAPPVTDWNQAFHPIGRIWLRPYSEDIYFAYPPWTAAILAPFHLIPAQLSRAVWAFVTTVACSFTNKTIEGDSFSLLLLVTSIPFISLVGNGQTDGIVILGFGLITLNYFYSELVGSILILGKPQTLLFVLPFLFLKSDYKKQLIIGGMLFGLLTFTIWGWWIPEMFAKASRLQNVEWNWAFWPYGIPAGILMLYLGYRYEKLALGALATFFLVPYIAWYSLTAYLVIVYAMSPRWLAILTFLIINFLSFWLYLV